MSLKLRLYAWIQQDFSRVGIVATFTLDVVNLIRTRLAAIVLMRSNFRSKKELGTSLEKTLILNQKQLVVELYIFNYYNILIYYTFFL